MNSQDIPISTLGAATHRSPLTLSTTFGDGVGNFVREETRVRFQVEINTGQEVPDFLFEKAGPRERLFFDPPGVRAAIVTCGGLCPGLNNVIRSAVLELYFNYGVKEILGIRYGFEGLVPDGPEPLALNPDVVEDIHREGGTILGSSRGAQDIGAMVGFLQQRDIRLLLCLGGDGTQRGAHQIAQEVLKRRLPVAVVGIPKTIDNDIQFVKQTFGFFSAVDQARQVLDCAHNEAKGAPNGIGLVKVMGRDSGFIASFATLASQEVNFTLIPELPLKLDGPKGFLGVLERRMRERGHALIVVAEGAGQDLIAHGDLGRDASGNPRHADIGTFLRDKITAHFAAQKMPINLKYIDPSYIIRSVRANNEDNLLCDMFGRCAVHAGMAGKTDLLIGSWNGFIHVPIEMATKMKRQMSLEGDIWTTVISATGQPRKFE